MSNIILPLIPEPYRTMVVIAQCLGLRVSEILGLQWRDLDFESLVLRAKRGVVQGRVDRVKSGYSEDDVPLDPTVAQVLQDWEKDCSATPEGWLFLNQRHASRITRVRFARTTYGRLEKSWG